MADWGGLERELDVWAKAGRTADLWLRDDDAGESHPTLDWLLDLTEAEVIPLALAAIPARVADELASRVAAAPRAAVLQHGYAHINHAEPGGRKCELGPERPAELVIGELATGWDRLDRLFGGRAIPVLVPPWNRIGAHLIPLLPEIGYRGLSTFGPRRWTEAASRLTQINTHIDIIDWKGSRGFAGEAKVLGGILNELRTRRSAQPGMTGPIGVLTHHLAHDAACWVFLETLLACTARHPAVRWRDARDLFDLGPKGGPS